MLTLNDIRRLQGPDSDIEWTCTSISEELSEKCRNFFTLPILLTLFFKFEVEWEGHLLEMQQNATNVKLRLNNRTATIPVNTRGYVTSSDYAQALATLV